MSLNRRQFVVLGAAVAAGCAGESDPDRPITSVVDAGPASQFASDGVYDRFRSRGFFLVRSGDRLQAVSSVCTHRGCILHAAPDHTGFKCQCHGSRFDLNGAVTKGPARRKLPELPTSIDASGHLLVHPRPV